ncbi:MAG: hypothetical protein HYT73_00420 [Candidatus Aenigmarchaeota archaeon]|nr:hypothetical protein [Candidatus Aenigmarchaeota archaeon]
MATTIAVSDETKEMLKTLGTKDETYDDIIRNMMIAYEEFLNRQYKRLEERNKFKKMVF